MPYRQRATLVQLAPSRPVFMLDRFWWESTIKFPVNACRFGTSRRNALRPGFPLQETARSANGARITG